MSTALKYQQQIDASIQQVWYVLTDAKMYRQWAKAFSSNTCLEGEWKQGSYMNVIDPGLGGTKAFLATVIPEQHILAKHIAIISQDGEESTTGDMATTWIGTTEEYTLSKIGNQTQLTITVNAHENWVEMFDSGFPKALPTIKTLAEATKVS
jgi:uncharacterized protein YndB with AHSA1/START domain